MLDSFIRDANPRDIETITALNDQAFGETAQSKIIKRLIADDEVLSSKLCLKDNKAIGHVMIYKVRVDGQDIGAGLGPVSVLPAHQKRGCGTKMIRTAISEINPQDRGVVFVLGHFSYYPRFGFTSEMGARFKSPWPRPAFMAMALNGQAPQSGVLGFPQAYL